MIFLSYSRKDIKTMQRIKRALTRAGVEVWTDEVLEPGTFNWFKEIDNALEKCDAVVVLLSENSYDSEWVIGECDKAKALTKNIFPLLISGDPARTVSVFFRVYQFIDLRKDFRGGVSRLINTLQAKGLIKTDKKIKGSREVFHIEKHNSA